MDVINKHAPLKRKYIRANHVEYMDQELSLAIRSEENRLAYKKRRNFCVTLLKKKKADKILIIGQKLRYLTKNVILYFSET